ncbi:MAG: helix-turn-helix transcriptional regulator [bacterium]
MKRLLTVPEVAEILGFTEDYIYRLAQKGKIPAIRIPPRSWRFDEFVFLRSYVGTGDLSSRYE